MAQAPFDSGLVVVMDGMGETLSAMQLAQETSEAAYMHDLLLEPHDMALEDVLVGRLDGVQQAHREAESVYAFDRVGGAGRT